MTNKNTHIIMPERAPTLGVPLRYFIAAGLYLIVMLLLAIYKAPMLVADYLHNPATLALTHLFTMGFAGSVVSGALYQITPVLLFSTLHSERLANLHLGLHVTGVAAMVWGFYHVATIWTITGGTLILTGAVLFGLNLYATFRKVERWNPHGALMALALLFYLTTLGWGMVMAFNQRFGFLSVVEGAPLGAHLTLGMVGWFGLMVVGVGLKLVPMFAPAAPVHARVVLAVGGSLVGGVLLTVLGLVLPGGLPLLGERVLPFGWVLPLGLLLLAVGLLGYTGALVQTYRRRRSVSRPPDFSVRFALTAALLLPLPVLLLLGAGRGAQAGLVLLYALGFVGGTILGMLLRIVPFMVWLHRFRHRATKRERIPFLHEMFHYRLGWIAYLTWFPGVGLMAVGMAVGLGAVFAAGAVVALVGAVAVLLALGQVLGQVPLNAGPRYPGGSDPA